MNKSKQRYFNGEFIWAIINGVWWRCRRESAAPFYTHFSLRHLLELEAVIWGRACFQFLGVNIRKFRRTKYENELRNDKSQLEWRSNSEYDYLFFSFHQWISLHAEIQNTVREKRTIMFWESGTHFQPNRTYFSWILLSLEKIFSQAMFVWIECATLLAVTRAWRVTSTRMQT